MIPYERVKIAFYLFDIGIGTEVILNAIGLFFVFWLIYRKLCKSNIKFSKIESLVFILLLIGSSYIFARLIFFIIPWKGIDWFLKFFYYPTPALNSIGGMIGGIIFVIIYFKIRSKRSSSKITAADVLNNIAPYGALIFFFFRIGCYMNGHIRGKKTIVFWCIEKFGTCRHPVSFYLSLNALFIFIFLKFMFENKKIKEIPFVKRLNGEVGLWFLFLYFLNRFIVGFFVVKDIYHKPLFLGLDWIQVISFFISLFAIITIIYRFILSKSKH